jgi:hypothetical protein
LGDGHSSAPFTSLRFIAEIFFAARFRLPILGITDLAMSSIEIFLSDRLPSPHFSSLQLIAQKFLFRPLKFLLDPAHERIIITVIHLG